MLKNILNLKGAQQLTKREQKNISGGRMDVNFHIPTCLCGDIVMPVHLCDVCTLN